MDISEITRRNILDYLIMKVTPFHGRMELISFLGRIWDLSSMPSTDFRHSDAEGDIQRHMVWNDDWDNDYLLARYLELMKCEDELFSKFLENCVHPLVLPDQEEATKTVTELNRQLAPDGYRLEVLSQISGNLFIKSPSLTRSWHDSSWTGKIRGKLS